MNELNDWCNLSVSFDFCAMKRIINKLALMSILDNTCEAKIWKINENEFLLTSIHVCVCSILLVEWEKWQEEKVL